MSNGTTEYASGNTAWLTHRDLPPAHRRRCREACARGEGPHGALKIGRVWTFDAVALARWFVAIGRPAEPRSEQSAPDLDAAFGAVRRAT